MKKIVLFVLALVAVAIANEEEDVKQIAEKYEIDIETAVECLREAGTNIMEIHAVHQKMMEMKDEDNLDEETKEVFMKHGRFVACILEKKDMMKDSKLVPDKILESMDSERTKPSKEDVTKCVNELNEANEISKEQRALGLLICFVNNE